MDDIVDVNTLFGPLPVASTDLTVDALLALMQKHSVRAACTLSTLGLLLDPTVGNAATGAACREHPELIPVATLNPTTWFGDRTVLQRIASEGFRLLRFFPDAQGWPLEFAPFRAMLRSLEENKLPVMIGVEAPGAITTLARVMETYPAPVILTDTGVDQLAEIVAELRHHENWYVEISHLLAPGAIKCIADTVGVGRLLFGTGAPSTPIAGALETLRHSGLPEDALRHILSGNARRILNL